jgi:hypothetical protein
MKKTIIKITGLCFLLATIITGCKKDGATGPAGPAGNANVTQQTFTVTTAWQGTTPEKYYFLTVPSLTSKALMGSVNIYYSWDNINWSALPTTVGHPTGLYTFTYMIKTDTVRLSWLLSTSNGGGIIDPYVDGYCRYINVVVIPPAMIKPNTNHHNYAEVKEAYGLND